MSKKKIIVAIALIGIICIIGLIYWGNYAIELTVYEIPAGEELAGLTIVQVSDLHNEDFKDNYESLLNRIKEVSPDLIAVTGDLIDSSRTDVASAMEFINQAVGIAPVYYVTGNHEAAAKEYNTLRSQLIAAGVIILDNEAVKITYNNKVICLMGVSDPNFAKNSYSSDEEIIKEQINYLKQSSEYKEADYTILLSHRPEAYDVYVECKVNLVLSGHAHGGQFRIPFIGGVVAPNQGLFPKYTAGMFENGDTKMIVSRGLGNSIIPFRVNNRPEVVVVEFK